MAYKFKDRLSHAWNAFTSRPLNETYQFNQWSYSSRPDRLRMSMTSEKSIVNSIYNRIAVDVSSVPIRHVRVNEDGYFQDYIKSYLDDCLTFEANIDQTGIDLIRDLVMTMFDEGCVAVVPVDTDLNPTTTSGFDIKSIRVGSITQWNPQHVRVKLYDDHDGQFKEITLPKRMVSIIENPLYSIMNEPNSTLKRLIEKLNLLDYVDKQSGSGRLDLIIQLPFAIKTEARREQADARKKQIEDQLSNSKFGIAYTDGTEKITQLNRSVENNLSEEVDRLTSMLYSQLGLTTDILEGRADEQQMLNYENRTLVPILDAICTEFSRKFLTKTARTKGERIKYIRNPFRLVPVQNIADIADKFTRNEVLTSNEVRSIIGFRPSSDPEASELRNKNLNKSDNMPEAEMNPDTQQDLNVMMNPQNGINNEKELT